MQPPLPRLSIMVSNPARNAAASAKSSVGPAPTHIRCTSITDMNPPRIAVLMFARLQNVTKGTASSVSAIRRSRDVVRRRTGSQDRQPLPESHRAGPHGSDPPARSVGGLRRRSFRRGRHVPGSPHSSASSLAVSTISMRKTTRSASPAVAGQGSCRRSERPADKLGQHKTDDFIGEGFVSSTGIRSRASRQCGCGSVQTSPAENQRPPHRVASAAARAAETADRPHASIKGEPAPTGTV